jgi:tRNA(fMet)-specific endonuclease VapC
MVILDSNVLIEILKGNQNTIHRVQILNEELAVSSISVMELYYGARNKKEVNKIEKFVSLFTILHLNTDISIKAVQLIERYAKSHTLDIPDSLIASTALVYNAKLFTYNSKDFRFIDKLVLVDT